MQQPAPQEISLLWPEGTSPQSGVLSSQAGADLGIHALVEQINMHASLAAHLREKLRNVLLAPDSREAVIRYRQEVLEDCLTNAELLAGLNSLLPRLAHLGYLADYPFHTHLEQITTRLGELEIYVECVQALKTLLDGAEAGLHSVGLIRLHEQVSTLAAREDFQDLAYRLPELRKKASGVVSIAIGVNLDTQLHPNEATLLSLNDRPYTGARDTFLSRLFFQRGGQVPGRDEYSGIAPLHTAAVDMSGLMNMEKNSQGRPNPLLLPLFQDLDVIMRRTFEPVARALKNYVHMQTAFLVALEPEIAFYSCGAWLVGKMREAGMPVCRAEIAPLEERVCQIQDLYPLNLTLRREGAKTEGQEPVITNDIDFGESGRILILTGPNQGGKTTFTQAAGLAQALFQAGYYVPGSRARISPADHIFTHFPLEEKPQSEMGRLGEEAQRLSLIFREATTHSLVLLNESLTTTSPGESIYLARDILRALRLYGVRAIFVTHLHELAENIEALEASTPGASRFASLVAGVDESSPGSGAAPGEEPARRTYKIRTAPPMGRSYAGDIARRHGISYEQLEAELRGREHR